MLVSRNREKASPLVMSRIVAKSLLRDLGSGDSTYVKREVDNIIHLLEMYRLDEFNARQRTGILRKERRFDRFQIQSDRDNLMRLKAALRAAHESFSPGSSAREFTQDVTTLLREVVDSRETSNVERAANFLAVLSESLSTI
jgi:hypothetical protein